MYHTIGRLQMHVTPIIKKDGFSLPQKYWPVSLTLDVSISIKDTISSHIMKLLDHNHITFDLQHGIIDHVSLNWYHL